MFREVMIILKKSGIDYNQILVNIKKYFYCFGFDYNESSIKYFINR